MVSNEEIKRMLDAKRMGVDVEKEKIKSEKYKVCPNCKTHNPEKAIFCVKCGKKMDKNLKVICPKCGTKNENNAKFCVSCGETLEKPEVQKLSDDTTLEVEKHESITTETSPPQLDSSESLNKSEVSKIDTTVPEIHKKPVSRSSVPSSIPDHGLINKTGLKKTCPACNGKNLKNAKFCVVCGEKFDKNTNASTQIDTTDAKDLDEKNKSSSTDETPTAKTEKSSLIYKVNDSKPDIIPPVSEKVPSPEIKVPESIVELKNNNLEEEPLKEPKTLEKTENDDKREPETLETKTNIDPVEKIKKAKELLDMGAITNEEFENIKKKYLEMI
jgi:ribosomal protein L40E